MAKESQTPQTVETEKSPEETSSSTPTPDRTPPTDWESQFKYLLADFDNFRRRTERDRAGIRSEAEANLLRRLIPIVEGFENAETAGKTLPPSDPLRRGLELLGIELGAVLQSVGFAPVAKIGEPFRHDEHEAVGETAGPKGVSEGAIAAIVQQGYRFQGGLLRPAKVLVARTAHKADASPVPPAEPGEKDPAPSAVEEGSV
jgi:molecular chaperone GrpE